MKKNPKPKREGPIKIPLPFEEAVSDFLKVKPEQRRKASKVGKRQGGTGHGQSA
jgi:hypothetical protein